MIIFLLIPIFFQDQPTFMLTDQHGDSVQIDPSSGKPQWIVWGNGPKTARLMRRWLGQKPTDYFKQNNIFCVADISNMPQSIKEKRFLPQVKAFKPSIYIIDGGTELSWIPRRKGVFTLIFMGKKGGPKFHFASSLREVEATLIGAGRE